MVPFSAFATAHWTYGLAASSERYNGMPSLEILGAPAPGESTGDAMAAMETLVAQLPPGIGYEWTGLSLRGARVRLAGAGAVHDLAADRVPVPGGAVRELVDSVAVMLVVPLGILGTVLATMFRGLANDVYFQVGLLTTVGLAAKNAILIVEFAKENYDSGMDLIEATVAAARQRLRPILMTSMAFILGVLPLAIATGAGAGGRERHRHRRDRRHADRHGAGHLLRAGVLRQRALRVPGSS